MNRLFPSLVRWFQNLSPARRTLLTIVLLFSGALVFSWTNRPSRVNQPAIHEANDKELQNQWEGIKNASKESLTAPQSPQATSSSMADWPGPATARTAPFLAQAAEVAVATKDFKKSRTSLAEILERHHAYAAKLRMVGQPSGSTLMATLRVPSSEFSTAVDDLKTLGRVEREEQTADEITVQRADVEARLRSAQNTLAKLKEMLEQGWKAGNPAEVQRQITSVSAEIARLQAEKTVTERRVLFSQVLFSLREEIQPPVVSLAAQFQSAAFEGFSDLRNVASGIALFVLSQGPVLLLWVVLIYFPSRWAWRKWRPAAGASTAMAQGE